MRVESCSSCGGRVEFSPQDKTLKCVNCGALYPIQYKKVVPKYPVGDTASIKNLDDFSSSTRAYKCNTCGATVTFNRYDIATNCQYCHSNSMVELKDLPGLKPEKIIPFKIDKNEARVKFAEQTKKRKFLPNQFKKNLPRTELGATYLSAFSFASSVSADYTATESYTVTEKDSRGVTRTVTKYRTIRGHINRDFDNVVVENSDKINQEEIRDILPYDFNECYDFDVDFIKGYNVGYYNQDINTAQNVAKQEMILMLEEQIDQKHGGVSDIRINANFSNVRCNYTLLPAYFVDFKYKNKPYRNMLNGQTGKVGGKVPRSAAKITIFVLFILALIGIPLLAILLFC